MSKFAQTMFSGGKGLRHPALAFLRSHTLALNVITTAMVAVMGAAYVVQVNGSVANGYAIRELEDQIHDLALANQKLEVDVREAKSLQNVNRSVKMLGLVAAETPRYLSLTPPSVAMAR